ncbi:DNA mismatch repair protein MutT [Shewanella mangrovi]|uniref:DNA mismatch repair protein MutT n=1 Tax=Shewanella mangrovi TaxID=1515746 RepID=A0A094J9W3_9GAMM|nr:DNA mismatch repair protein MutT [Shewanella mangrovi]KFZ36715.1 DNA mismatch repair protein MutT [Shewanella mangrovi]
MKKSLISLALAGFLALPSTAIFAEPQAEHYNLQQQRNKIVPVQMPVNTAFLNDEEKQVVNKLIKAAKLMSEIYLRQINEQNPQIRAQIASSNASDKSLLLNMFDEHFGPWDTLAAGRPFFGDKKNAPGAGFYPQDITKKEFNDWIAKHPEDKAAFTSLYTVIRRDGNKLVAIPYSQYYAKWLEPAAKLLEDAALITKNPSLKKFLVLRAHAFRTDDYFTSEIAWMDLKDTPIEVAIGPYENYTDGLFGYKTAFEAFVTIKDPDASAKLDRFKKYLRDMEANLPVDDSYKNFKRGFESPIAVADQIQGGGDNVPGVQTIAFNLPNDEKVREAKGAKKVLLNNVMAAKFERIMKPMAQHILIPEQAKLLDQQYFGYETLFHELSHSLGPGSIVKNGKPTTVAAELQELYSGIEEGKADVMGAYNILFLMKKGELPMAEKNNLLATYAAGLFRSMRFGVHEAHGIGAAFQYSYYVDKGALTRQADGLYKIDFDKLEQAITDLVHDVVVVQGDGNYQEAKAFLTKYGHIDDGVRAVNASLGDVPVDIQPLYPDHI